MPQEKRTIGYITSAEYYVSADGSTPGIHVDAVLDNGYSTDPSISYTQSSDVPVTIDTISTNTIHWAGDFSEKLMVKNPNRWCKGVLDLVDLPTRPITVGVNGGESVWQILDIQDEHVEVLERKCLGCKYAIQHMIDTKFSCAVFNRVYTPREG